MRFVHFFITAHFLVCYSDVSAQLFGGQIKTRSGIVSALDCSSAIQSGTIYAGTNITGVSVTLPYLNGNGGAIPSTTVSSTGISGLFASHSSGQLNQGSGSVFLTIFGTTTTSGIASFIIAIGGQNCQLDLTVYPLANLYPANTAFCSSGPTVIVDITNPTNGKTWMDRNLGASQVATSATDANAYGDLFQWGRRADGHQCRNSGVLYNTLSSVDQPPHGQFIIANTGLAPYDWRSPQNVNLWQGVIGINNPCPNGYRLPTATELNAEQLTWSSNNASGAFASPLKFTMAGHRHLNGTLNNVNDEGGYYTSTIQNTSSKHLLFTISFSNLDDSWRGYGRSVRCIKETVGSIGALNCSGSIQSGNLISGQAASNVSVSIPYSGGNGGYYAPQTISSTGVTGLTASLAQGMLASGSGNFTLAITGTPSSQGTASFNITIGGQNCTLNLNVIQPQPQYPAGTVYCNGSPTLVIDVTNPSTGKTWMDRNLGASQVATSATDANAYGDLYQWGRRSDGHQCRTSGSLGSQTNVDQPNQNQFIPNCCAPQDWRIPQNPNLWQGIFGVNNPCPSGYRLPTNVEVINESNSWSTPNSSGAFNSVLKMTLVGSRKYNDGLIQNVGINGGYWTSSTQGTASIYMSIEGLSIEPDGRAYGYGIRCIKETVGSIGALNCSGSIQSGNLISGQAASNVSVSIPYSGGNGGYYAPQTISSTGVTGLTASLAQGMLASGSGNFTLAITGTPSSQGTASFNITIGGQNCTLNLNVIQPQPQYPAGTVYCNGSPTLVIDVTNPSTGKTWMDRNLGASQVAISATDANAYGDLYQWGRRSDGHQCRTSLTTNSLSSVDQPSHGSFIINDMSNTTQDWRIPQNSNLWQGVNGINNPCPVGYRLPTEIELNAERATWSSSNVAGGFASNLKWVATGRRFPYDGFHNVGNWGYYWSSTVSSTNNLDSRSLQFSTTSSILNNSSRGMGNAVRCIKN